MSFAAGLAGVPAGVVAGRAVVVRGALFVFIADLFAGAFAGSFVAVGAAAAGVVTAGTEAVFVFPFATIVAADGTSVEIAPLVQI